MSLPTPPKMPRQFLCTKCGSRTCEGSIDVPYPPCSNCGYLGFASDAGHTDEVMQAYGQQCRDAALEEAAKVCDAANPHPDQYSDLSEFTEKRACLRLSAEIRSLK